jgi:hypothetical protein
MRKSKSEKRSLKKEKKLEKTIILKNIEKQSQTNMVSHFLKDLSVNGFTFDFAIKIRSEKKEEKKLLALINEFENSLCGKENEPGHFIQNEKINSSQPTKLIIPFFNRLEFDKQEELKKLLKKNLEKNKEVEIKEIFYTKNKNISNFPISNN